MRHQGWKIGFGLSWLPAGFFYWLWSETFLNPGFDTPIFQQEPGAIGIYLFPLLLIIAGQSVLGYYAFRR